MKNILCVLIVACFLFPGCTRYEKDTAAREQIEAAEALKDSVENELVRTMDEINQNLDLIREKQGLILNAGNSESLSRKQEILKTISLINSLIEDNKKKIEELSEQSKKLESDKSALSRLAKQTRTRIEKQEQEIALLKQQLAMEEFKVADLNNKMDEMQVANEVLTTERALLIESNAELDKSLNKGYFTYGTAAQLKEKNIIEKKGGFMGIGKKNALANAFHKNRSWFSELDIREMKSIPVHGKDPRVLTFHPDSSYEWKNNGGEYSSLNIKDPEDFWSVSRFLVVEVK